MWKIYPTTLLKLDMNILNKFTASSLVLIKLIKIGQILRSNRVSCFRLFSLINWIFLDLSLMMLQLATAYNYVI